MPENFSKSIPFPPKRFLVNRGLTSAENLGDKAETDFDENFGKENLLDGCYHVYLDVGSNIGIQVRKLFEPQLFPDAPALALFDTYFGTIDDNRAKLVCAVGFEPNPRHTSQLKNIEAAHSACGWRSYFYTDTAGVNFINVLQAAFTPAEPKSLKKTVKTLVFYASGICKSKSCV